MQFFGGYFHQDWTADDPTDEAVIVRFISNNPPETLNRVVKELDQFLSFKLTESELRSFLFDEFLCFYLPAEGSFQDWLIKVRRLLANAQKQ